jgi:hypothetical protein
VLHGFCHGRVLDNVCLHTLDYFRLVNDLIEWIG